MFQELSMQEWVRLAFSLRLQKLEGFSKKQKVLIYC